MGNPRSHFWKPPFWPCIGWGLPSSRVATGLVSSYLAISPLSRRTLRFGVQSRKFGVRSEKPSPFTFHLFVLNRAKGARDGIFSVALSLGLPPVPVRDHPARRCPDFPPRKAERPSVYPFFFIASFASLSAIVFFSLGIYCTSK